VISRFRFLYALNPKLLLCSVSQSFYPLMYLSLIDWSPKEKENRKINNLGAYRNVAEEGSDVERSFLSLIRSSQQLTLGIKGVISTQKQHVQ